MDWLSKIPPYESQYSAATHTDAQDCVPESLCHIIFMLTGIRYSPRALAYLAKVTPTGSRVSDVLAAANNNGLIHYELWPTPDSFTWESYYTPIPQNILDTGVSLGIKLIPIDLDKSPLWTEISLGIDSPGVIAPRHMVAQLNDTQYFDSETGNPVKSFTDKTPIIYQTSILITKFMTNAKLIQIGQEFGYWMPAITPDGLKSQAANFGEVLPVNADNTLDFSKITPDYKI